MKDLQKFVKDTLLDPACDSNNKDACTADQLESLEEAIKLSPEDRKAKLAEIQAEIKETEKKHEDLLESLQSQYKKSSEATEKSVGDLKKSMKWLKAVKEPKGKEEL